MTYSRFHPGKFCVFLDWETSGADFNNTYDVQAKRFQGVQLGIVIADSETFEEVDSLKVDIQFDSKHEWHEDAQKIHGITREYLLEHGVPRDEAAVEVIEFLLKYFNQDVFYLLDTGKVERNSHRVCFGGHNLDFDIAHLKSLLAIAGFGVDEHHIKVNSAMIGFVATGMYKSDDLFQLFGAEERGNHDALKDARQSLAVVRGVKALIVEGLKS